MKVLLVHNHYQGCGGESSVYSLERKAMQDAGVEVVSTCDTTKSCATTTFAES